MTKEHTIDASGKKFGRVASAVALLLRGKADPSFNPRENPGVKVTVKNASKISFTEKKVDQKEYARYTGFPGGLKKTTLKSRMKKGGISLPLRDAVYGMIPANKIRPRIMKNLVIEE